MVALTTSQSGIRFSDTLFDTLLDTLRETAYC
jgi:hypothetical protein